MKTRLTLFTACSVVAGSACAQSSVTLFGVVDAAARRVVNEGVGGINSLVSGSNASSRLGVRGTEDLGDGLSAGFWLEASVGVDAGTAGSTSLPGQFFDRQSYVSLASRRFGELRFGNDYTPTFAGTWGTADPFGHVGVGGSGNLYPINQVGPIRAAFNGAGGVNRNESTTVRARNMIEYFLPSGLGGVEGMVYAAAGEGGSVANGLNRSYGGRLGYSSGSFSAAVATVVTRNNVTAPGESFKDSVVYAAYDFSVVKLSLAVRQFKYTTSKQTNAFIGAWVPLPAGILIASYQRADLAGTVGATNIDANDANMVALGYVYDLSKRTALYATASRIDNKGAGVMVISGGPSGMPGGGRSSGAEVGIRHRF